MLRLFLVIVVFRTCLGFSGNTRISELGRNVSQFSSKGRNSNPNQILEPREVCAGCGRPPIQCLCDYLPLEKLSLNTHVLVLQHPVEFRRKTISTTPLLKLVLEHVQVLVGRSFDTQLDKILENAMSEGMTPLLLFPGSDAITLEDTDALEVIDQYRQAHILTKEQGGKNSLTKSSTKGNQYLLIIVDGTWTQARRMVRYSPILMEKCQQIQFTSTAASTRSIYDPIRKQPDSKCLSTLESCSRTLTLLEPNNRTTEEATKYLHSALKALVCTQISQERKYLSNNPESIRNVQKIESKRKRQKILESDLQELHPDEQHQTKITTNVGQNSGDKVKEEESFIEFKKDLGDGFLMRNLEPEDALFVDNR